MTTLTFKEFMHLVEMDDTEFALVKEGLSDLPGFSWLKSRDNKLKLQKIEAERQKLKARKDQKSKELDAKWAQLKAEIEGKPTPAKKPVEKPTMADWDAALDPRDRKFLAKMDKYRDNPA